VPLFILLVVPGKLKRVGYLIILII
jgi:hypothetical protein